MATSFFLEGVEGVEGIEEVELRISVFFEILRF